MAPRGPQDEARLKSLKPAEREALSFECSFYEGLLAKRPECPEALASLASAYTALGFYEDGLALDRRISARSPDDPVARYNLACSQALTGNCEAALESLRKAQALGYEDREHMARDEDLSALHPDPRFWELARGKSRSPKEKR
ncbi:MAG: hypothetical protein V1918_10970 [Planctomycetota bacterium]